MEPDDGFRYRIVYGEAARLLEVASYSLARGKDVARRVEAESVRAEVDRLFAGRYAPGLIGMAIDDAIEGRKPRW